MAEQASKTLSGAFIVGGVALFVAGLVLFGSGRFFQKSDRYVLFFEDSLKGLDEGAPVMFQGVKIGSVTDTQVEIDRATLDIRTPVHIEIERQRLTDVTPPDTQHPPASQAEMVSHLINRGLRAQLQMQSLVTGKLFVALDFFPDKPVRLVGHTGDMPELPTVRTGLSEATDILYQLVTRLEKLPLEKLLASMQQTFHATNELLNSSDAKESFRNLNATLNSTRKLADTLDRQLPPMSDDFRQTLRRLDTTLATLEGMMAEGTPPRDELLRALKDLSAAARSFNSLADYLQRHPESLLRGKPEQEDR